MIAQVVKQTKAEIKLGKQKNRAESSMEGLGKQGEKMAKLAVRRDKEQMKNALGVEDQNVVDLKMNLI